MCFHGGSDNSDSDVYSTSKVAIKDAIQTAKGNLKQAVADAKEDAKAWQRTIANYSRSLKGLQRDLAKSK